MNRTITTVRAAPPTLAIAALAMAVLAMAAACGTEDGRRDAQPIRRDSAGIEIVESPAPAWGEGEGWRLAETPSLDIGTVDGPADDQLFQMRDALVLDDGRIAVANGGSHEVRFYGPDGEYLSAIGGEGDGPGEFQSLASLTALAAGELRAWDLRARRISDLDVEEGFRSSTRIEDAEGAYSSYVGTLSDGRMVTVTTSLPDVDELEDGKLMERDATYWLYAADGTPVSELARFPGGARIMRSTRVDGRIQSISILTPPFRIDTQVEVVGGEVVAAVPDRFEVRFVDPDGRPRRIARYDAAPVPVTPELVEAWVDGFPPERRDDQRAWIEGVPMPERAPTVRALVVDAEGNAWLRQYGIESPAEPSRWTVLDSTGAWLGAVDMPPRFRPFEIGADYVLGEWTDELDVEHLRRFALLK